uniref:Peroxisomal biogenesis factor 11 gamma n=1 Tax=Molossus molossus TaxID=27622 RepID=A0A7J8IA77_MOLMO|nr:peroxisomal biogenesis factor 11 gamma [Molossus molossus]
MRWGRGQLTLSTSVCLFARMVTTPLWFGRDDPSHAAWCYHPTQLCLIRFLCGAACPASLSGSYARGPGLETPWLGPGSLWQDRKALRSLWVVLKLRHQLRSPTVAFTSQLSWSKRRAMEAQIQSELLILLSNLADLADAVHWLPAGVLWAGRIPPWLVGLLGTISSLLSVYQAVRTSG